MDSLVQVITLSCNQLDLTYNLISDIQRERESGADVAITVVDNGGGYERQADELIIKPAENLRWVRGVNLAFDIVRKRQGDFVFCLNDDIRLSRGFFEGIVDAFSDPQVGLVAPCYDDVHQQQLSSYRGLAQDYTPIVRDDEVNFVDGTAFALRMDDFRFKFADTSILDAVHFGRYGWGSDIDLSYRIREIRKKKNIVTHRSFINHFHQGSAKFVEPDWSSKAGQEMEEGMTKKYGENWRQIVY